jgi:RNA polymerase sigma-70 factor (ECF subfamily)
MGVQINHMSNKTPKKHAHSADIQLQTKKEFQHLYEHTHLAVFRYIYGLHGGPKEEVEDLTTTTYLRAWKSRYRFRGNGDAAFGWLLKIARNLVIDAYRRQVIRPNLLDIEKQITPAPGLPPEDQVHMQEQIRTLWGLIAELPNQQREIIVLRYLLDWRVKDIATYLEKNENNISVTIRRVLKRLQDEWPDP